MVVLLGLLLLSVVLLLLLLLLWSVLRSPFMLLGGAALPFSPLGGAAFLRLLILLRVVLLSPPQLWHHLSSWFLFILRYLVSPAERDEGTKQHHPREEKRGEGAAPERGDRHHTNEGGESSTQRRGKEGNTTQKNPFQDCLQWELPTSNFHNRKEMSPISNKLFALFFTIFAFKFLGI